MAKLLLTFLVTCACLAANISHAQWTQSGNVLSTSNLVGIGISTPVYPLTVNGSIYTNSSLIVDGGDLYLSRQTYGYGYVVRPDADGYRNLQFACAGGAPLDNLSLNSKNTFASGNFGVNTSAPQSRLHIEFLGDGNVQQGLFIHTPTFVTGSNAFASYFIKAQDGGTGTYQFIVHGDGSTGICTETVPGYRLSVNGAGIFTKVVVKQNIWADYVFDSAYQLMPLKDLRRYVKDNHHLPDIPTADSVAVSGIDLGASQTALLKKIEELTLYTIAQDEQLQKARQDRDDTRAELKSLQERLDKMERQLERTLKHE